MVRGRVAGHGREFARGRPLRSKGQAQTARFGSVGDALPLLFTTGRIDDAREPDGALLRAGFAAVVFVVLLWRCNDDAYFEERR